MRTDNPEVTINFQKAHLPTATYTFEVDGRCGKAIALVRGSANEVYVSMSNDQKTHILAPLGAKRQVITYSMVREVVQAAYMKLNGK